MRKHGIPPPPPSGAPTALLSSHHANKHSSHSEQQRPPPRESPVGRRNSEVSFSNASGSDTSRDDSGEYSDESAVGSKAESDSGRDRAHHSPLKRHRKQKHHEHNKDAILLENGHLVRVMEVSGETFVKRFLQYDRDKILVRSYASSTTAGPCLSLISPGREQQILLYEDIEFIHIVKGNDTLVLLSPFAEGDGDKNIKDCVAKLQEVLRCTVKRVPSMRGCVSLSVSLINAIQKHMAERTVATELARATVEAHRNEAESSKEFLVKKPTSERGIADKRRLSFAGIFGHKEGTQEVEESVIAMPATSGFGLAGASASSSSGPLFAVNELCLMLRRGGGTSSVSAVAQRVYAAIDVFEIKTKLANGETLAESIISLLSVMCDDIHSSSREVVADIASYIFRVMAEENVLTILSEDDYRLFITTLTTSLATKLVTGNRRAVEVAAANITLTEPTQGGHFASQGRRRRHRGSDGGGDATNEQNQLPALPPPSPPICRCIAACLSLCQDFEIVNNLLEHHFPNDANTVIMGTTSDTLGYTGRSYGYILTVLLLLQSVAFTVSELAPAILTHHTEQMETLFQAIVARGGSREDIVQAASESDCGFWSVAAHKKVGLEEGPTGRITAAVAGSLYPSPEAPTSHLMMALRDSNDVRAGVAVEAEAILQFMGKAVAVGLSVASGVLNEVVAWPFPHLRQRLDRELSLELMDWCWQLILATNHAAWECSPVVSGAVLCDALPEMSSVLRRSVHWCELTGNVGAPRQVMLMLAAISTLLSKCTPRADPFDLTSFGHEWIIRVAAFCGGMAEHAAYYEFHLHYCSFLQRHRNRLWWSLAKPYGKHYVDWWANIKTCIDSICRTMPSPSAALVTWERIASVAGDMTAFPTDRDSCAHRVSLGTVMFVAGDMISRVLRDGPLMMGAGGSSYFVMRPTVGSHPQPISQQLQEGAPWEDYDDVFNSVPPMVVSSEHELQHALHATTAALVYTLDFLTVEALSDRLGSAASCLEQLGLSLLKAGSPPLITRRLSEGAVHLLARNRRGTLEGLVKALGEHFALSLLFRSELTSALAMSDLPTEGMGGRRKYISSMFLEAASLLPPVEEDSTQPDGVRALNEDPPTSRASAPAATPLSLPEEAQVRQAQYLLAPINRKKPATHTSTGLNASRSSHMGTPVRGRRSDDGGGQGGAQPTEDWPETRDRTPSAAVSRIRSFGTPIHNSSASNASFNSNLNDTMPSSDDGAKILSHSSSRQLPVMSARPVDILEMIAQSYR